MSDKAKEEREIESLEELASVSLSKAVEAAGGQRALSRLLGIPRSTLQERLQREKELEYAHRPPPEAVEITKRRGIQRFILSAAQDGTAVFESFISNLEVYRDWFIERDGHCEIIIAGFTYNKTLFEDHAKTDPELFHDRVRPYLRSEHLRIADRVDFCAEMNTLPTATKPLSDLQTYTRQRWGIFPHAKAHTMSVATMKFAPTKMNMTTGAVTLPNYVMKKAGIKASFHHVNAAILVEVDPKDGTFFCRRLTANSSDGSFYDLDRFVKRKVTSGHRLKALTPGDIHTQQIDPVCAAATFGIYPTEERVRVGRFNSSRVWKKKSSSLIDFLDPKNLLLEDVCDFRTRNHHTINDPYDRLELLLAGTDLVEDEMREVAMFVATLAARKRMKTIIVESNHDLALLKWMKTCNHRADVANALFWVNCERAKLMAIHAGRKDFSIFEEVMRNVFPEWKCDDAVFLREDQPGGYLIGDIDHSNHGHNGSNGSKGSVSNLARIGPKTTSGHNHTATEEDGAMSAGTTSLMNLGYNKGASSWSHTHVAQYESDKRAFLTMCNGKFYL